MEKWFMVGIAALGALGQLGVTLYVNGMRQGKTDERLNAHDERLTGLEADSKDHGERISTIEGRLDAGHGRTR